MEVLFGLAICVVVFLIIYCLVKFVFRRFKKHIDEIPGGANSPSPNANSGSDAGSITIDIIKAAPEGIFNWDENGNVFMVNSDGSVTGIGRFDIEELEMSHQQDLYNRLVEADLLEMVPRMWSLDIIDYKIPDNNGFILAYNDDVFSVPICHRTTAEIKDSLLGPIPLNPIQSDIADALGKVDEAVGYMMLMPSNEKEYILSLGAKACIERLLGNKIKVRISPPAVMGAFGIAVTHETSKSSKISFAFGDGADYMCCNLLAEDGVCEVKNLLRNSIIQPSDTFTALNHIAKGCFSLAQIREGHIKDWLPIDMFPYAMSLLLKENGRVIKIYDYFENPTCIPARQEYKDIDVDSTSALSFFIGSNEMIEDILAECNVHGGKIGVSIEIDSNMGAILIISSNNEEYKINIGELIG